ncbi:MAG: hypothetical protein ACPG32_05830 [Akkermansiaceae bacterium]
MKTFLTSALYTLTLTAAVSLQAGELIRQVQQGSGLVWDYHPSAAHGNARSSLPVGAEGSLLTYYSSRGEQQCLSLLDSMAIGTNIPQVTLEIASEDPHFPPRTRADKPFNVYVRQGKTQKPITLVRQGQVYHPKLHAIDETTPSVKSQLGGWKLKAGRLSKGAFYTSLPNSDVTRAEGVETFTAYHKHGEKWQPLKSAQIQVWPVASASFSGMQNGQAITSKKTPKTYVNCQNLYPDSLTFVQIYRGKQKLGRLGAVLTTSVVRFDSSVPQDQKIPLGEWADTLADGTYTLELLTITPFNGKRPERLAAVTVVLDRGMHSPSIVDLSTVKK